MNLRRFIIGLILTIVAIIAYLKMSDLFTSGLIGGLGVLYIVKSFWHGKNE